MKKSWKTLTKRMLFEYPLTRLELIIMILGFILVDLTESWVVCMVWLVWLLSSEYTTTLLQCWWRDRFGEN